MNEAEQGVSLGSSLAELTCVASETGLESLSEARDASCDASQQSVVLFGRIGRSPVVCKLFGNTRRTEWENEVRALALFAKLGISVPGVRSAGRLRRCSPRWCYFIVMERVLGTSLQQSLPFLSTEEGYRAGELAGNLLATQLLAQQLTAPQALVNRDARFVQASWSRLKHRYHQALPPRCRSHQWLYLASPLDRFDMPEPVKLSWVTYDWRLRHVLLAGDSVPVLLDLEYTRLFDPAADVGGLLHDVLLNGAGPRCSFAAGVIDALRHGAPGLWAEMSPRIRFYMLRQALHHAAVRAREGPESFPVEKELIMAEEYWRAPVGLHLIELVGTIARVLEIIERS